MENGGLEWLHDCLLAQPINTQLLSLKDEGKNCPLLVFKEFLRIAVTYGWHIESIM